MSREPPLPLGRRVLLMDGAMGTRLLSAALDCGERTNLERPEQVRAIHAGHARAGAEVLLTCTFQANPIALGRHRLEGRLLEICRAAIGHARSANADWVLGDIGPICSPGLGGEFRDREALLRVVRALGETDGLIFETCSSASVLAALAEVRRAWAKPLLVSFTFLRDKDGALATFEGHSPEELARLARQSPTDALGVNCGRDIGLADVEEVLRRYRAETDLPLFARPNAGSPGSDALSAAAMGEAAPRLLAAGACMVGGCCGTTEEHVAAMKMAVEGPRL